MSRSACPPDGRPARRKLAPYRRTSTASPPSGESVSVSVPPCSATCWATIASPSPVPGAVASRPRANGSSSRSRSASGMPGPSSATRSSQRPSSALEVDVDPPAAVDRGVLEQVVDDQPQPVRPAVERALAALAQLEGDPRMAAPGGVDGGVDEVAELDLLARERVGRLAAGERLQPVEQVHDPVLLGGALAQQRGALVLRQVRVALERVEVRAQRGERGAQLVPGVGGEAAGGGGRAPARRASIALSAPASERTSSGPSSGSGVLRSSAPPTRAAPSCSRASGRTASVLNSHAASPVSAEREQPDDAGSAGAVLATRASTFARLESTCSRASGATARVSERQARPSMSIVSKPSSAGGAGRAAGTSPRWATTSSPYGDLDEAAGAGQQRLPPPAAAEAARRGGRAGPRRPAGAAPCRRSCGRRARRPRAGSRPRSIPPTATASSAASVSRARRLPRQPHGRRAQPTPRTVCSIRGSPAASSLRRT